MISLKAFLPTLSSLVGLSTSTLYERQRALVRLGLLPTPTARGRNSGGAMATPDTVAMMLIAVLATDNLSEMDDRIRALAEKKAFPIAPNPHVCRFTKKRTFYEALAATLADQDLSAKLQIEVKRKALSARLIQTNDGYRPSQFGKQSDTEGIEIRATFRDLSSLSRKLKEESTCKATSENDPPADGPSSLSSATPPRAKENASGIASKARKGRRKSSVRG